MQSSFAETRKVDFTKGSKRDEVSFFKNLARMEEAKKYNLSIDQYEKLLRMHKSGKYVI